VAIANIGCVLETPITVSISEWYNHTRWYH